MFVLTMGKNALRRAGAAIACMACIAGVLAAADRLGGGTVTTGASAQARIGSVQEMAEYFTGLGMEVDVTTAAADRVKIPRKWDDSFRAFNGVIAESGLSLEKYKGRKVEKWTLLCPALSGAEGQTYGVLLLYKEKPVGVYLLTQPGGEVTGVESARQTMAEAALQQGEEAAAAAPEEEAEIVSADIGDEEAEAAEAAALAETAGEWPVD
ncbi:MAG: DUF4830 domain-containing protein [Subdoligranulum sp.]|nr:DUF4830 domain-containing protein [Subdoligranulum sp.]MCI7543201.1 DUF4830 domain-containing protein [Subdoligranulum sp.]MDD7264816.1 DUF4830 domain-containing protein [Subdoligranulum sp.]MDY5923707.1 DUF4830 domain-containing protein [Oscillospiraceae bacterium]